MFAAPEAFEMSLADLALLVLMEQGSITWELKQQFPAEAPDIWLAIQQLFIDMESNKL